MKIRSSYASPNRVMSALAVGALLVAAGAAHAQKRTTAATRAKAAPPAAAAAPRTAHDHGYVAGYNDGYTSGKTDYNTRAARDYERSTLYQEANRGYEMRHGSLPEFQGGYRLGYELGYSDGYHGRDLNAKVPAHAAAISAAMNRPTAGSASASSSASSAPASSYPARTTGGANAPPASSPTSTGGNRPRGGAARSVPADTVVRLRLNDEINTKVNREGDKFTAVVVAPGEFEGATVEGYIAKLKRSGRLTGQTELGLEFEQMTYPNGRSVPFRAQVERVFESEQVKTVDEEGNVQTGSNTKDTTVRSAGGAALGAVIGAIAGGGKGAAIGAILGAGVGAGSVYVQGNKDLIFERGTEMEVKTFGPRQ
jgi:hypothetical protein